MKSKKIIISLGIIGVVSVAVIIGTIAYFNDTEVSAGNIFVAGSIDLKVDHIAQSYNGVDCKTCDVTLISDTSNMVVERSVEPGYSPHPAVLVSDPHVRWTADVGNSSAKWIWATDPTLQEDTTNNVIYTFEKRFSWYGPYSGIILSFAVGSDNSVEVWFNGVKVAENLGELGYQTPIIVPNLNVQQGENILQFKVKNWAQTGSSPSSNPGGLLYALNIDGNCDDDYFKSHCTLWGEKDLDENDQFFNFDDIKPGDHGINVISLHVDSNDAYACLIVHDDDDQENSLLETEESAGDALNQGNDSGYGELSNYIDIFVWEDLDNDGLYEPPTEEDLYEGSIQTEIVQMSLTGGGPTEFIGLAWCAGDIIVDHDSGDISCDGNGMLDDAQSDSFEANLTLYAEQIRNNPDFDCDDVDLQD